MNFNSPVMLNWLLKPFTHIIVTMDAACIQMYNLVFHDWRQWVDNELRKKMTGL